MSPALPGQRAAQRPLRAMTASQRALGRAATAQDGGLAGAVGVGWIDGRRVDIDLLAPPGRQVVPVPEPCECRCVCACSQQNQGVTGHGAQDGEV
ncbi:hypothetical protein [Streptomyces sp. NPDC007346]|uniref:hypothetical protein n=1 Tax=Streptomyces sp. NPDC007346 TaxID=3154682 RepID=UPI003454E9D7